MKIGCLPNSMPPGPDDWASVVTLEMGMAVAEGRGGAVDSRF